MGEDLHEFWQIICKHIVHVVNQLLIQLVEFGEIKCSEMLLEACDVGKIPHWQVVAALYFLVLPRQVVDELLLLGILAEHGGHFVLQVTDNVSMHLCQTCSLDQLVDFAHGGIEGKLIEIVDQIAHLLLKELDVFVARNIIIREGTNVYSHHFRGFDDLPQRPHEGTIDPHQLLIADQMRFVQHDPHLVIVPLEDFNDSFEFVRNVQLVSIEEQQDHVRAGCKPLTHRDKVVAATNPLFFA
eukprot:Lithocolla_globosa_v1_NODE_4124_length_1505_cov_14.381379.p2 type:complete len:241 gc:universal NODE_4124_length_1505_cov_14.381379:1163-441(-)